MILSEASVKKDRTKSTNLKKTKKSTGTSKTDDSDEDSAEEHESDNEKLDNIGIKSSLIDTWIKGSEAKAHVLGSLIQNFGSFVIAQPRPDAVADHRGNYKDEDKIYSKLYMSSVAVFKAQKLIRENENPETRDFTIFVAQQRWVDKQLRPLLELCRKDDGITAMRCCKLGLTLMKQLHEKAQKALFEHGSKKSSQGALQDENGGEVNSKSTESKAASDAQTQRDNKILVNAKDQLWALLSFKEGLCSAYANEAISNIFRIAWSQAQDSRRSGDESLKSDVAAVLYYVRRLFAIEPHPFWSSVPDVQKANRIHNQYIVQLRHVVMMMAAICADIKDRYHDTWLRDVILITCYTIRNFEAKDLFKVWKEKALLSGLQTDVDGEQESITVPEVLKKADTSHQAKGLLSAMRSQDRNQRANSLQGNARQSRFKGVYTINTPVVSSSSNNDASAGELSNSAHTSKIIRGDPLATSNISSLPQKKSRAKKNLTFAVERQIVDKVPISSIANDDGQQACVVAASLVDMLVSLNSDPDSDNQLASFPGINFLIHRVNDDLRRDEMMIDKELELMFFQVVSKCLMYNRFKLTEEKRLSDMRREIDIDENGAEAGWQPDLRNILNALDKISFNRVITTIERLNFTDKQYRDVVHAIEFYKEQLCYLRVLCESDNEAHNSFALAGLFRVFYTSISDRIDPLPKLLQSWKPALYEKKYLTMLVELVHETMKTLEAANSKFLAIYVDDARFAGDSDNKKKKKMNKSKDVEFQQYVSACLSFNPSDYFKRIVSNTSVRMYTMLVKEYNTLDARTVHYVYSFLSRMTNLNLEQRYIAPEPASIQPSSMPASFNCEGSQPRAGSLTLGFMLFNIHSLMAFNALLNDAVACSKQHLEPLVRLVKMVVRRFSEAAKKNRMLFVEALFQHPQAHEFCETIDNVYEAPLYATGGRTSKPDQRSKKTGARTGDESEISDSSSSDDKNESDEQGEEEFDEEFANKTAEEASAEARALKDKKALQKQEKEAARKAKRDSKRQQSSQTRKSKSRKQKRSREFDSDNDDDDIFGGDDNGDAVDDAANRSAEEATTKRQKREKGLSEWTEEEDSILKSRFGALAGTSKIFDILAKDSALCAIGNNRKAKQIERRVQELQLHLLLSNSIDDDNDDIFSDSDAGSIDKIFNDDLPTQEQGPWGSSNDDNLFDNTLEYSQSQTQTQSQYPAEQRKLTKKGRESVGVAVDYASDDDFLFQGDSLSNQEREEEEEDQEEDEHTSSAPATAPLQASKARRVLVESSDDEA